MAVTIDREVALACADGRRLRLRIIAEESAPVADLAANLREFLPDGVVYIDSTPLPEIGCVGDLDLVDGSIVSQHVTPSPREAPVRSLELRVVGGPDAGRSFDLGVGKNEIGRMSSSHVRLIDRRVSRQHATLVIAADLSAELTDHSSTGTFIEGARIQGTTPLRHGQVVQVGSTLVQVIIPKDDRHRLERVGGAWGLHRRFRSREAAFDKEIVVEEVDDPGEKPKFNLAWSLAPAAGLVGIALYTGRPEVMLFSLVMPLMSLAYNASQRRAWARRSKAAVEAKETASGRASASLAASRDAERQVRRSEDPDLAELVHQAALPGLRLWERDPGDPGLLDLRVGVAVQASEVVAREARARDAKKSTLWAMPLRVGLEEVRNLAITGDRDAIRSAASGFVLQLATRVAPTSLKIFVFTNDAGEQAWDWVAWLPHARLAPEDDFVLVASELESQRGCIQELTTLIAQRTATTNTSLDAHRPSVLIIVDDLKAHGKALADILRAGASVGVHAICLDEVQVPGTCLGHLSVPTVDGHVAADAAALERKGEVRIDGLLVDLPSIEILSLAARALSPLQVLGEAGDDKELPTAVRLIDLLQLAPLDGPTVARRWDESVVAPAATVGVAASGDVVIDLVRDGPHALFAGTTRSGKTEFVRALIAALALDHHPDDLQVLIIDCKGEVSVDYDLVAELPHVIELTTQTDSDSFERTLALLKAEIGRRTREFNKVRASNLDAYLEARREDPGLDRIGRLVVVVDEYARLVAEAKTERIDRLVAIAQTGAAFGVHLVLAVQRPTGVVGGQIAANVALRACFRVEKPEEAIDVIDSVEPANISGRRAGRGYYKGKSSPFTEFQSARVTGRRPGATSNTPVQVRQRLWHELGPRPEVEAPPDVPAADQDLADVVDAVRAAATTGGWTGSAVPWPAPLPSTVSLEDLPAADRTTIPFSLLDDVPQLRRVAHGFTLGGGTIGIAGSARQGRTTALLTTGLSFASRVSAAAGHLYVLDFASGGMRALSDLPHLAGASYGDLDQAGRIVASLTKEVRARGEVLAEGGYMDIVDQRASSDEPLPFLLLLVDGWPALLDEGARIGLGDDLMALLERSASAGLQAVIAGDRTIAAGRMGRILSARYALHHHDKNDFTNVGVEHGSVPATDLPPGRALLVGTSNRVHFARIGDGSSDAIRGEVARIRGEAPATGSRGPTRLEPLPESISLEDLLGVAAPPAEFALPFLAGRSSESSGPLFIDLHHLRGAFVTGPRDSGKSTALLSAARALLELGRTLALVVPGPSPLRALADQPGVRLFEAADQLDGHAADLVIVDDGHLLAARDEAMTALVGNPASPPILVALDIDALTAAVGGWIRGVTASGAGLVLCPRKRGDGMAFGRPFPEHLVFDGPPGRAVAGWSGRFEVVQVAT